MIRRWLRTLWVHVGPLLGIIGIVYVVVFVACVAKQDAQEHWTVGSWW